MKIAVVGTGKTGSEVVKQLAKEELFAAYNSSHTINPLELARADVCIVFIPGDALNKILPILIASKVPVVCGSTGFSLPANFDNLLREQKNSWVHGSNFSLGMNIVFALTKTISHASRILPNAKYSIHEAHHVHKKDNPSGTALTLQRILQKDVAITAEREGDIKGFHELSMFTDSEKIRISHEVFDRKVFADGAVWAAKNLAYKNTLGPGLHLFEDCVEKSIIFKSEEK